MTAPAVAAPRVGIDETPEAQRIARERFRLVAVTVAADVLERENAIVLAAVGDALRGRMEVVSELQRRADAVRHLAAALEVLAVRDVQVGVP